MEKWGQEISVSFRIKGLNLPITEEDVKCQMKIKDIYKSNPGTQGAKGSVFGRLGPMKEGSTKRKLERVVDPTSVEVKQLTEEEEIEEIVEVMGDDMDIEEPEGAVALWPGQGANRAMEVQTEQEVRTAEPTKAIPAKWKPITAPSQDEGAAGDNKTTDEDKRGDITAKGARPKTQRTASNAALMLVKKIQERRQVPQQLAIMPGPAGPEDNREEVRPQPQRSLTSIRNWQEDRFMHGPKDFRVKCFANGCDHVLYRSQMRGHCLKFHLPEYFCGEKENEQMYEVERKIELRKIAVCKIMSTYGCRGYREIELAAKIIVMQAIPEATVSEQDRLEINRFLGTSGTDPLPAKAKILDNIPNGLLCWQAAVALINALTPQMKRQILPVVRTLGEENRLR